MKSVGRISRTLFERVRSTGKRLPGTAHLQALFLHDPAQSFLLAVVCPNAVVPSAVSRNSLRRRIRGRITQALPPSSTGILILFARPKILTCTPEIFTNECIDIVSQVVRLSK